MLQNRWEPTEPEEVVGLLVEAGEVDPTITQLQEEAEMEARIAKAKETCRQRRICTYIALVVYFFIFLYFWRKYHHRGEEEKPST